MIRRLILEDESGATTAYVRDEQGYNRWRSETPADGSPSDNTFEDAAVLWTVARVLFEHSARAREAARRA